MKKTILALAFIALCIALYTVSEVYATTCALPVSTSPISPKTETNDYNTPTRFQPVPHTYGDPINDPRPKAKRAIMI